MIDRECTHLAQKQPVSAHDYPGKAEPPTRRSGIAARYSEIGKMMTAPVTSHAGFFRTIPTTGSAIATRMAGHPNNFGHICSIFLSINTATIVNGAMHIESASGAFQFLRPAGL